MRRGLTVVLVVWWLIGLAGLVHVVGAYRGSTPDRVDAQVAFLDRAIAHGAGAEMQALFPEGEFFTVGLTALAAGNTALGSADPAVRRAAAERLDRAIATLERPEAVAIFGDIDELEHGTFHRGWVLLLRITRADLVGGSTPALQAEADAVAAALAASPVGVPASYPDQRWPCDAVVAMAAVRRTHQLAGRPTPGLEAWLARLDRLRDPATGLLPHRIGPDGAVLDGPRGSSQSIIQTFWGELSPTASRDWAAFRRAFVVREAGLVGVREYPVGAPGAGDVDSGPLVLGVSASASTVTLGAARAQGDTELAAVLDREAELLGLPVEWAGARRFAGGAMPAGDAFVAWARTQARSVPVTQAGVPDVPTAWGTAVIALVLAGPVLLAPVVWLVLRRRGRPR